MGNHECWNGVVPAGLAPTRDQATRLGITLPEGDEAEIAGARFLNGTLRADERLGGHAIRPGAASGKATPVPVGAGGHRPLTKADATRPHGLLRRPRDGRPVVVVTHHAPHPSCMPEPSWGGWPPATPPPT